MAINSTPPKDWSQPSNRQQQSYAVTVRPTFFVFCSAVLLVWAVGLVVGASDRFEAGRPA